MPSIDGMTPAGPVGKGMRTADPFATWDTAIDNRRRNTNFCDREWQERRVGFVY